MYKKLKILLINPSFSSGIKRSYQPLGVAYLAAYLREKGYEIKLLDANCLNLSITKIIKTIKNGKYNITGFYTTAEGLPNTLKIAYKIKEINDKIKILFGGPQATFIDKLLLKNHRIIDFIIRGEGEITLCELLKHFIDGLPLENIKGISYRIGNRIYRNPSRNLIANLDSLPFPARDLLPPLKYYDRFIDPYEGRKKVTLNIVTSRGCPFNCYFCVTTNFYRSSLGKPWRSRDPMYVINEIEDVFSRQKFEHIDFGDDNLLVEPDRVVRLFKELEKKKMQFTFSFSARADQVSNNESLIKYLKKRGLLCVEIGLESGNQRTLNRYNKKTKMEENFKAIKFLKRNKIILGLDFIMFDPWMSLDELMNNYLFLKEIGAIGYYPPIIYNYFYPYPGTYLTQKTFSEGLCSQETIYEIPPYRFKDKKVKIVSESTIKFIKNFDGIIKNLVVEIEDQRLEIRKFLRFNNIKKEKLKKLWASSLSSSIHLRQIPYLYFEEILNQINIIGYMKKGEIRKMNIEVQEKLNILDEFLNKVRAEILLLNKKE